jgi:hypothetical protein
LYAAAARLVGANVVVATCDDPFSVGWVTVLRQRG